MRIPWTYYSPKTKVREDHVSIVSGWWADRKSSRGKQACGEKPGNSIRDTREGQVIGVHSRPVPEICHTDKQLQSRLKQRWGRV